MRRSLTTLLGVFCVLNALSQQFLNKKVFHYTLKDGLSSGFIINIIQDNRGFMWFNTHESVDRFDGINFKTYKFDSENPYSLPRRVQYMYKDNQGDIWISSLSGIYNLDTKTERFIKFKQSKTNDAFFNNVNSISSDNKSVLWFSCNNAGLISYNKSNHQVKTYTKKDIPALYNNLVITTYQDSKGLLWVGGNDSMICVHHAKDGVILKSVVAEISIRNLPKGRINTIYEDYHHDIWIATSKGLIFYHRAENKFYVYDGNKYNLQSNYFFTLIGDNNHNLFIGLHDGGLYTLNLENFIRSDFKNFKIDPVVSENSYNVTQRTIECLYQDKDKNIWAGSFGEGIYLVSNVANVFKKYQDKITNSFGTTYIRYFGICMDAESNLWLGTDGQGIYKRKLNGELIKHYYADGKKGSLTNNAILSACVDHANNLWFGSYLKGLFKYDKKTDSFINYQHRDNDSKSLCSNDVRAIFEDSKNNLWVGTNRGGLSELASGANKFINFTTANSSILSNNIMVICEDSKNNLLIGTYTSGLMYYLKNQNKFVSYFSNSQTDKYLPSKIIYSLKFYKNNILIGTVGDGLVIYNIITKKFKIYSEKNGLANNIINAIQPDNKGTIWVSTNAGVSKIDVSTGIIVNYDTANNLQTGHFNSGSVIYSDKNKFMCFGGTEGYNIFNPKEVQKSTFKPNVIITGFKLFGKDAEVGDKDNILNEVIDQSKKITLKPDQTVFSLQWIALNYGFAEKSEFAYKLEGLDRTWNYALNQKIATYRYVEPGNYTFKIKASNQDGVWFDDYTCINITILPPWYKTWWAYLGYCLVLIMMIYYYNRYRTNQSKLEYEIKVAQISTEKEKELNEKKLSFFTNLTHEFRTPLTLIINPIKDLISANNQTPNDLNDLHIVYRNTKRLLSLVDQLLLFRKVDSENDELKLVRLNILDLCNEVLLCFSHQFTSKKINLDFEKNTDEIFVFVDREKIEIVLFNLLSNALKFTPEGGKIVVSIEDSFDKVNIKITDTGCGIPANVGDQLFNKFYQVQSSSKSNKGFGIGLYLVKTFIDCHKGNITYVSTPDIGTSFEISLFKERGHLSEHLIFEDVVETSVFLDEIIGADDSLIRKQIAEDKNYPPDSNFYYDQKSMLIVEDNEQIREYLTQTFQHDFTIYEADNGNTALSIVNELLPNFIISDVILPGFSGVELCSKIKNDVNLNHIPVILLTGSTSLEIKLQGIEGGADDYITKPFDKEMLIARVNGLLKSKNNLKEYFYNEITLKSNDVTIPVDFKEFLVKCIEVVEAHLRDKDFCVKGLSSELRISHSKLYKKIKSISGQSANEFIRFIRLRKAAEILINTNHTVTEAAYMVGINDYKYFREQFNKLFGLNPSNYIKKFRKPFQDVQLREVNKMMPKSINHSKR